MNDPIFDGVKLLFIGMGTVVVFLFVMIWCMGLLKKLIAPIEGILDPEPVKPRKAPGGAAATAAGDEQERCFAAASAAMEWMIEHRKNVPGTVCTSSLDGKSYQVKFISADTVSVNGTAIVFGKGGVPVAAPVAVAAPAAAPVAAATNIESPLPGTVMKLHVAAGDTVAAGTVLMVLEAMKMETPICAEKAGRIADVCVSEKEVVTAGQVLIVMEGK